LAFSSIDEPRYSASIGTAAIWAETGLRAAEAAIGSGRRPEALTLLFKLARHASRPELAVLRGELEASLLEARRGLQ
ncbi:MAG: hypothetical protein LBG06_06070, partial [Deltaproteobacteria bacterium]|nr:hypothetical protein [Deltaproteobacteria bacterium]